MENESVEEDLEDIEEKTGDANVIAENNQNNTNGYSDKTVENGYSKQQKKEQLQNLTNEIFHQIDGMFQSKLYKVLKVITRILITIPLGFFLYIVFAEFLYLNFYTFLYQWISILAHESLVHIIFSIFGALSNFGYYLILFSISFQIISNFIDIIKILWNLQNKCFEAFIRLSISIFIKFKSPKKSDHAFYKQWFISFLKEKIVESLIGIEFIAIVLFILFVLSFIFYKIVLVISIAVILLLLGSLIIVASFIKYWADQVKFVKTENAVDNNNENHTDNNNDPFQNEIKNIASIALRFYSADDIDYDNEDIKPINNNMSSIYKMARDTFNILFIGVMFNKNEKNNLIYQIIVSIFILMSQTYYIVYASMNYKLFHDIGKAGVVLGIIGRLLYIYSIMDINIIDVLLHMKRTWRIFQEKIVFCLILILYFIAIFILLATFLVSKFYDYPSVEYVEYVNRNDIPFIKRASRQNPDNPYGYCKITTDDGLNTIDLSILTTLPRLYAVNDNGKCYIKPKLRGVFNSTMNYIFGTNYSSKGIRIYCWTKMHKPYLVITSEESYLNKLKTYSGEDVTILNNEEIIEQSDEYFNDTNHLCDSGIAETECRSLQACIQASQSTCEEEWSLFTNKYWQLHSETYDPNLKGLEQYQITISDSYIFQPRFIFNDTLLSGTHYIIGGGVEDQWGYASLIENTICVLFPDLFESFLPFFSFAHNYFREMFNYFSEFALTFIYVNCISSNEIREFGYLINRFNFSTSNIYMVGHSISATTMKEISYLTNISGIAFEGSRGLGYAQFRVSDSFPISAENLNQLANIYSGNSFLSGEDQDFNLNGALPSKFINPNIYDTACLTVVTCSSTEQYIPYCHQVLNQHGEDSMSNFIELIDAYLHQ